MTNLADFKDCSSFGRHSSVSELEVQYVQGSFVETSFQSKG